MSNSAISFLTNLLDSYAISSVGSRIGESDESVSRGLRPTFAAILGGMASRVNDSEALHQMFDTVRRASADSLTTTSISSLASGGAVPPRVFDMSRALLTTIFGSRQNAVANAIERDSDLSFGSGTHLITLAAPIVLGFLGKQVRDEGLDLSGFTDLLQRESANIRSHLPAGLGDLGGMAAAGGLTAVSIVAATDENRSDSSRWLLPLLAVLALSLSVYSFQRRDENVHVTANAPAVQAVEGGNRTRAATEGLGTFLERRLPGNIRVKIPENGVEARLLASIQDASPAGDTWFDFDRLNFSTGSAIPLPDSEEQLQNIASIMKAYPTVRLKIGGYTDNTGDAKANRSLSENRAESVRRELIAMGVAENRVEAEGYGIQHPVAENSTEEGRTKNRRISMRILEK